MFFPSDFSALPSDGIYMPSNDNDHRLAVAFREFIDNAPFPCVGAKSALSKGRLVTIVAGNIGDDGADMRIHTALLGFIAQYRACPDLFQSFAVIFEDDHCYGEDVFERHLWARAQALCEHDAQLGHPWDGRVAAEVDNPHFSLSVAGEGFFIVGLHPGASRPARRFQAPVLVFNLHDQFERLRRQGRYEKLRASILKRDEVFAGSINPMLARHGDTSEARQYSGRAVEEDWQCPFQPPSGLVRN